MQPTLERHRHLPETHERMPPPRLPERRVERNRNGHNNWRYHVQKRKEICHKNTKRNGPVRNRIKRILFRLSNSFLCFCGHSFFSSS
jgi:hypothetical protein